ncbi:ParB N-terminal domain-containing protein [Priestia koreensis]|uniref:ParB N-terminal domain-containing protein n=1 Tax=Priestia koreensis TaxID=284581 RepID=UPI003D027C63
MSILKVLELIPVDRLKFHEEGDSQRIKRIMQEIQRDGVLKNPIMVSELQNGDYFLLDGLHRSLAIKELGFKYILAQKVELTQPQVKLLSWTHQVPDHINLKPYLISGKSEVPCFTLARSGQEITVYGPKDIHERVEFMHQLTTNYYKDNELLRLPELPDFLAPGSQYVSFIPFNKNEFDEIILKNIVTPPGITRLLIPGRILNLQFPLTLLEEERYNEFQHHLSAYQPRLRKYTEEVYMVE